MYVKDIMTREIITVREVDTVEKCANLLITHGLSGMPVVDERGQIKGMVTESDLIKRVSKVDGPAVLEILGALIYLESPKKFIDELEKSMGNLVRDIMTEDLITINPDKRVEDAATLLVREKIKRLPVIDDKGNIVGIISRKDIMNHLFYK